jgi:hypothetical protein
VAQPKSSTPARFVVISPLMPWAVKLNARKLKQQADELAAKLLRTREELEISERQRVALQRILEMRLDRIGDLNDRLERARAQARRLDIENEILARLVNFTAPPGTAMIGK